MVYGIEKFKDYFDGFEENYIIIGGSALSIHYEALGEDFKEEITANEEDDVIIQRFLKIYE
ncbi:MAG: hypothetical protein N4A47_04415 [Clostridia bacterium]|jgi:galactose-1-phosphate uridylyltransferase|nr:hypothetical protein [Clostridia bacterium]